MPEPHQPVPPVDQQVAPAVDPDAPAATPADEDSGRSKLAGVAADVASTIVDAAQAGLSAAQAGITAARPILHGVEEMASGARRAFDERSGARVRRVRRMGREPLANLWELHPEARRAAIRELGLLTVAVDQVAGTAV